MKQMLQVLEELKMYAGCDSIGTVLTEDDVTFMFIFTELGVLSKISVPLHELYNTKLTDSEMETLMLEEIHAKVNAFKRDKGILD